MAAACRDPSGAPASRAAGSRPNVLLITLDTTRADRISCYGFGLARTEHIDRLAVEGVRCVNAQTVAPITLPAHASILTGLLPPAHGVRDNGAYALGDDTVTLAERLHDAGYETRAFVSAMVLGRRYNLTQGFDSYDDDLRAEDRPELFMIKDRAADQTAARVIAWLDERGRRSERRPFFAWVHYFDPHEPHESRYPRRWLCPTPYDAEIAAADQGVGAVIERLRADGVLDRTLVVLTADHGESLGEHGEQTHAIFIYDATMHVPLILRYPPALPAGRVYSGAVRVTDIAPTVLAAVDLPGGADTQGENLLQALRGEGPPPMPPQYGESLLAEVGFGMAPLYGVREGGFKYIRAPRPELYDLAADPRELNNVIDVHPDVARRLERRLDDMLAASRRVARTARANPMDRETTDMLQALGYLAEPAEREAVRGMDPKDGIRLYNLLEQARALARLGRWSDAEAVLLELLAKTPGNVAAQNVLALSLLRQGKSDSAEQAYAASLRLDSRQHRVLFMLALMNLQRGALDEAERLLRRALELTPRFVEAMVYLGFVELQRGRQDAAEEWYRRAIAEDPGFPRAYLQYADLFFVRRRYDAALDYYQRTLRAAPGTFNALVQAGLCQQRLGNADAALDYFAKADALRPDSWTPAYNRACVLAQRGDSAGALNLLDEAVKRGLSDEKLLRTDDDLRSLRGRTEFEAIVQRIRDSAGGGDAPGGAASPVDQDSSSARSLR